MPTVPTCAAIFYSTDTAIDGTWRVNTTSDDDFMGFVFGEQDSNHYDPFDWKKADQNDATLHLCKWESTVKLVIGRRAT